jgi:hypothetical protein
MSAGKQPMLDQLRAHRLHRVQGRGDRLAAALAGRSDVPLPDGLGVADRHAQAVAGEGLAQRRPRGSELSRGGVHAAKLFRELQGAFGLGAVGEEAAGLPAQRLPGWLALPIAHLPGPPTIG